MPNDQTGARSPSPGNAGVPIAAMVRFTPVAAGRGGRAGLDYWSACGWVKG